MPNIKPLRKLVSKAREVREHHRERHTPSGFAFALADSIDYLDQEHWDKVTSHDSLFLSRAASCIPSTITKSHRSETHLNSHKKAQKSQNKVQSSNFSLLARIPRSAS